MLIFIHVFWHSRCAEKKYVNNFITGEIIGEKNIFPQLKNIREVVTEEVFSWPAQPSLVPVTKSFGYTCVSRYIQEQLPNLNEERTTSRCRKQGSGFSYG